jgi:putative membrane protein
MIWTSWHGHPEVLIGLVVLQAAYLLGVGPLREKYQWAIRVESKDVILFTTGVVVLFVAMLSPLHVLADDYLFSAHMLQHVLMTLIAPPLLILGTPDWLLRPLLKPVVAYRAVRLLTNPFVAFFLFNMTFSLWHIPAMYGSSVLLKYVHIGEHMLFMSTATLMWWPLVSRSTALPRLTYPFQMIYLFGLSLAQIIVFGMVTFSQAPVYEHYVHTPRIWGIDPLADQQIGGIIMKVGGGLMFLTLFIVNFFRWYRHEEEQSRIENEKRMAMFPYLERPALEDSSR